MINIQRSAMKACLQTSPWLMGLLAATCIAAPADDREGRGQVEARLAQERAACVAGQSNQDTKTCLQEIRGARIEARRGGLDADPASYTSNQLQRCERLAGDKKRDCIKRMQGHGTTEGSVAAGGILRTLVTREAVPQPPAVASAPIPAGTASPASAASR